VYRELHPYWLHSPNVSGDDRSAILLPDGVRLAERRSLVLHPDGKEQGISRPNREFKFRSCFGPAFGSVTNQDFCCGLSFAQAQLHFLYYNFVRIHQTLKMSPAMAAGVTKRLWEIGDIVDMLEGWEQSGCARC
jgi:hypothetical protein